MADFSFRIGAISKTIKLFSRNFFPILIFHKPTLGSSEAPHKICARSVQPFWGFSVTNIQTYNHQSHIRSNKKLGLAFRYINVLGFQFTCWYLTTNPCTVSQNLKVVSNYFNLFCKPFLLQLLYSVSSFSSIIRPGGNHWSTLWSTSSCRRGNKIDFIQANLSCGHEPQLLFPSMPHKSFIVFWQLWVTTIWSSQSECTKFTI